MDFRRVILYTAFFIVSLVLWNKWEAQHASQQVLLAKETATYQNQKSDVPQFSGINTETKKLPVNNQVLQSDIPLAHKETTNLSAQIIHVKTDVLDAKITTKGGNLIYTSLSKYPKDINHAEPFVLLNKQQNSYYVAQSGLVSEDGPDQVSGQAIYTTAKTQYDLNKGDDLTVDLTWTGKNGIQVIKTFTFHRNSYVIDVGYIIKNSGTKPWVGYQYNQLNRRYTDADSSGMFQFHTYLGAAISSKAKPYEKITYADMKDDPLERSIQGGWAAMVQHYFLSAWIPAPDQVYRYYSRILDNDHYVIGMLSPKILVKAGETKTIKNRLYVGPELTNVLKTVAPHLELTVDYGILWFISITIFKVMEIIHGFIGNWGWSIVLVTALIKLLLYYPSSISYRSMAKMRKLQPKIEALRERIGDDRQKMSQELMALYKKEKCNPLSGCLPILIQIPIFLGLYWVLIESVELRQAPFIFWIHDLSAKDPYYILPIIMGLTMFIQQKLSPPPPDPTQAKIMLLMPVFFTVLFLNFPSGLVLYWLVNNVLSILQQWYITRRVNNEDINTLQVKYPLK